MEKYKEIIDILKTDNYYKLREEAHKLASDNNFLKIIINIHNPIIFDRFIKMCEFKIDTRAIYEERNNFIKKSINKLNMSNIYSFFEIENLDLSRQEVIANRYLTEYIISYYFEDNFYNFMTNLYQMTGYLYGDKKDLVSIEHIKIYEQFVSINKMSLEDKIRLFNRNIDNDLMSLFYDDLDRVRVDSHKELVDSTLKLDKNSEIYQKDLSTKLGADIYYLNGEKFYGFVRSFSFNDKNINDDKRYIYSQNGRLGYSFSYISGNEIGTIGSMKDSVLLYYDNIDYRNIMYVHHTDMHSGVMRELNTYITDKENEILLPSSLIAKTINYNEIYIKPGIDGIKPTAIVCLGDIDNNTLDFAKKYNLAILMINREKYKHQVKYDDDYQDYTYVL